MRRRQPLPRMWLMTDERQGDALWAALDRLPRGAGVVFRHYGLPEPARRALLNKIAAIARRKHLLLLGSGNLRSRRQTDGWHGRDRGPATGVRSAPAHDLSEIRAAERAGAALVFLSPVFPTRSHPGGRTLGPVRFGLLARHARIPVIALGGMNERRAQRLPLAYGWAGIDACSG